MDGEPAGVDVPEGEKSGKRATRGRRIDRKSERERERTRQEVEGGADKRELDAGERNKIAE